LIPGGLIRSGLGRKDDRPPSVAEVLSGEGFAVFPALGTPEARAAPSLIDIRVDEIGKALVQGHRHAAAPAFERIEQAKFTVLLTSGFHDDPLWSFVVP
jgi:hypothetical protein